MKLSCLKAIYSYKMDPAKGYPLGSRHVPITPPLLMDSSTGMSNTQNQIQHKN